MEIINIEPIEDFDEEDKLKNENDELILDEEKNFEGGQVENNLDEKDLQITELKLKIEIIEKEKEMLLESNEKTVSELHESMKREENKYITLLKEIIDERETYFKAIRSFEKKDIHEYSKEYIINQMNGIIDSFEAILINADVKLSKTLTALEHPKVSYLIHKPITTVQTENKALNGLIAESLGNSYEYKGNILLKEKVNIYKYIKNEGETNNG